MNNYPGMLGRQFRLAWNNGEIPGKKWLGQVSRWIAGVTSSDGSVDIIYSDTGISVSLNRSAVLAISAANVPVPHPWKIYTRTDSGNQQYSMSAGAVYNFSGKLVSVSAINWTTITSTITLYLNLSYSAGTLTITVSTTAATEAPYASTGTWSFKIGTVTIAGGVITDVLQTLHDYYDIRGRFIPSAITGNTYDNQQVFGHAASGSPSLVDVEECTT